MSVRCANGQNHMKGREILTSLIMSGKFTKIKQKNENPKSAYERNLHSNADYTHAKYEMHKFARIVLEVLFDLFLFLIKIDQVWTVIVMSIKFTNIISTSIYNNTVCTVMLWVSNIQLYKTSVRHD